MISILGIQRVAVIAGLIFLNLALLALTYFFIAPSSSQMERSVMINRSEGTRIQTEIDDLQDQFLKLDTQQVVFNGLKENGFFEPQGRREAEKVLRSVQTQSGVFSAKVGIGAAVIEQNEKAREAEHTILASPVNIEVQSTDDINIFQYIYILRNDFPGQLNVDEFSLERSSDVDAEFLRSLTLDEGAPPVKSTLQMTWRTMVPNDVAGVNEGEEVF